ncbi:hypothetical protein TNCV_4261 [Trichonephila clavipes]|nr:hypothetical protein TNCV_4261 [Trichonephila clavipes]
MATSKQKAFCVLQLATTESAITVQRASRIKFAVQPPNDNILRIVWYILPLPADLPDLRHRTEAAVARISLDILKKVLDELACGTHVCRVTNGAHIEHFTVRNMTNMDILDPVDWFSIHSICVQWVSFYIGLNEDEIADSLDKSVTVDILQDDASLTYTELSPINPRSLAPVSATVVTRGV